MAQHDMNIANQGFPATRADLNNALQALVSNSSGATAPSTTFANQWWYDTTNNKMYIRNEADNAWIEVFTLDQTNNEWQLTTGVVQAKDSDGLALKTDDGTTRLFIKDSDGNIGVGTSSPVSDAKLTLSDTTSPHIFFQRTSGGAGDSAIGMPSSAALAFYTPSDQSSVSGLSEAMRITSDGDLQLSGSTDNVIRSGSDSSRVRIFGGATASVGNGAALTLQGVSASGGNYADLASATGGYLNFRVGTSEAMRIQSGGEITSSNNPIFHCQRNSGVNNIAVNTTHTMTFASQVIDRGNNHDGSTFTAPVTGAYFLSATMRLDAMDTAATYYQIIINTSNRSYTYTWDPNYSADLTYQSNTFTVIADMDASDIAQVQIYQAGGSTQTDVNINSFFFGYLCG